MNFTWLNKQGVQADEGFVVQRIDRYHYHYVENGHVLSIEIEPGLQYTEVFLGERLQWEPPFENEEIDRQKATDIEDRIQKALAFMGIRHRFTTG